jgi:soluble lytic murein transglycosylase-like protein
MWRRQNERGNHRRAELVEELERLLRRVRALVVVVPLLLFAGAGVGRLTSSALDLPEATRVRHENRIPRVHIDGLSDHLAGLRSHGEATADYVAVYKEQVEPVEKSLRRRGVNEETARRIAWPLVEHAAREGLDPATVLAVVILESRGRPNATSFVGARGLMQVMPDWSGRWRGCGRDLYDIDDNLCNGTKILAWYYNRARGDERTALLGYNGCVRGTNTPDCHRYPDKLRTIRMQIEAEWGRARRAGPVAASP